MLALVHHQLHIPTPNPRATLIHVTKLAIILKLGHDSFEIAPIRTDNGDKINDHVHSTANMLSQIGIWEFSRAKHSFAFDPEVFLD